MKHKIILADDHLIFRSGLKLLLESAADFEVISEVDSGRSAYKAVGELLPELLILDLSVSCDGDADSIDRIKLHYPSVKILALTNFQKEENIRSTFQSGADGYLLKMDSPDELIFAVRAIVAGKLYISPSISRLVVDGYLYQSKNPVKPKLVSTSWAILTRREQEVLVMVAEGKKNREIAGSLSLSTKTIEKHRASMMAKLNFKNTLSLVCYAMENGLLNKPLTKTIQ